ncbi:putative sensor domain DACNV-containing protein [uncultured Hymenobacter sp.]|uniref:putative sensor domain DACNV-containing protein n=1 Tax=uncultured Hymenobacter sp. TaxID=170016 RepID=UPI0035C9D401
MTTLHYYPHDVALALHQRWPAEAEPLPPLKVLTQFISVLYQASLLFEEGRRVECHAVLASQTQLETQPVTLTDFHMVRFAVPRAWNEQELRRLSPAVLHSTSLLVVEQVAAGHLQLWGMLFSGHEWDQVSDGPRQVVTRAPQALLVQLSGPGSLVFYYGAHRVLTLQRGRIEGHGFLQFPRAWGEGRFFENQQLAGPAAVGLDWTPQQDEFMIQLILHMQRRALTRSRASGHGLLVVLVPTHQVEHLTAPGSVLRPKYRLLPPAAGSRYPTLMQAMVRRLLELGELSWAHYQRSLDTELQALTAEVDHFADYIADMGAVDGALVLTQQLDVVGFGVEIQATQVPLTQVYRALDVEARALQPVPADHGGTRHRAAYRLCLAAHECLAIVVSQDGGVQFVHNQEGKVIFWDQLSF